MLISTHDFALKDMEFTNSEYFELININLAQKYWK